MAQRYRELSNKYANAINASICVLSLEKENQMLKAQVESLTSKHVALQGTHKELKYSYEKLVESHAMLEVARSCSRGCVNYGKILSTSHTHMHMLTSSNYVIL